MLSALPKLADRDFVLGFLLPALLAAFAAAWVFPEVAVLGPLRSLTTSGKDFSELAYLVLGVWLGAVLLMAANFALYRVLEGYTPPFSWLALLRERHRRRFRELRSRHDAAMAEWGDAQRDGRPFPRARQEEVARLHLELLARYPAAEAEVMPTAFGNVLRAFEVYPREVYGVDAIPVWPRLASVVPADYAAQVNGARAQVDCFVNVAFLASAVAVAALARAAAHAVGAATGGGTGPEAARWAATAAAGLAVSLLSYRWATASAAAWGEAVKSAFDCYLPALIGRLGYAVPPTEAERRAFWGQINARLLYRYPMAGEWPLAGEAAPQRPPEARDGAERRGEEAGEGDGIGEGAAPAVERGLDDSVGAATAGVEASLDALPVPIRGADPVPRRTRTV